MPVYPSLHRDTGERIGNNICVIRPRTTAHERGLQAVPLERRWDTEDTLV
jgi:hypothetical protein